MNAFRRRRGTAFFPAAGGAGQRDDEHLLANFDAAGPSALGSAENVRR